MTFEAELIEGHKGMTVVLVPFDPLLVFDEKPVRLAGRRHGWLVKGRLAGVRFDGYIGERWGRFFVTIEPALRSAARVKVGDVLRLELEPTDSRVTLEKAIAQSRATTQPKNARKDVREAKVRGKPAR